MITSTKTSNPKIALTSFDTALEEKLKLTNLSLCDLDDDDLSGLVIPKKTKNLGLAIGTAQIKKIPIIAFSDAIYTLNSCFGGTKSSPSNKEVDDKTFITPGSKLAASVGGSGWVSTKTFPKFTVAISSVSKAMMASSFNSNFCASVIEAKGRHWALGVGWTFEQLNDLPKGFTNLIDSFVMRVKPNPTASGTSKVHNLIGT